MISNWDYRFLKVAYDKSKWSKDPSTKTGAVIVRPDRTEASTGYNGFPGKMSDNPVYYHDREEKYSRIIHCEMNALLHCREQVIGYTLYTWPFSCCDRCVVHMIQAGIERFVFPELAPSEATRWEKSMGKTKEYLDECGLVWLEIPRKEIDFA